MTKIGYGEILKKAREERKRTLYEVSSATKINKTVIQALEEEEVALLPSDIYVLSFMKKYAAFLEIEYSPIEEMYLAAHNTGRQKFYFGEPLASDEIKAQASRSRLLYYIAIGAVGIVLLIYVAENLGITEKLTRRRRNFAAAEKFEVSALLSVKAVERTDLSISNRGTRVYEGILSPGATAQYSLFPGYIVRIKDLSRAQVYFREEKLPNAREKKALSEFVVNRNEDGRLYLLQKN